MAGRSNVVSIIFALVVTASACDTGDGRTLDPPVFGLPATTIPTTDAPVGDDRSEELAALPNPMQVLAPWPDGAPIPDRHTCAGDSVSPALSWVDVPPGTFELVVTLTDLDQRGEVLWIVEAISPATASMAEGTIPDEAFERANARGTIGYAAPCPPEGDSHLVQFTLHALEQQLEVAEDATADEILATLNQTAIDQASIAGIVARTG